jgi:DeoR family fructose operon transcriptional repressor
MLAEQRRLLIVDTLIHKKESVTVAELSDLLQVSTMTVRRDLETLERMDLIQRVYGGAMAKASDTGRSFYHRSTEFGLEKKEIGRIAAALIQDDEKILFDAGTTTLQIAEALGGTKAITAITHALPVAQTFSNYQRVTTIILGGLIKRKEQCAVGPMVIQDLSRFSVDTFFLSAAGFDPERGIHDTDLLESEVKQAMIRIARRVILVADSSKFGVIPLVHVADWRCIQVLVTDDGIPEEGARDLTALGVEVITPAGERKRSERRLPADGGLEN